MNQLPITRGQQQAAKQAVYKRRQRVTLSIVVVVALVVIVGVANLIGDGGHSGRTVTTKPLPATTQPPKLNPVTIAAVGDTELGNTPNLNSDPGSILAPVEQELAAPILFGNLEGTMTDNAGTSKCSAGSTQCYAFRVPTSYAQVMHTAGFTVLNSANNHSHDFGTQGVADTSTALSAAGISQGGLPGQIAMTSDGATKVAFVDFAPYSNVNNLLDLGAAKQLIAQAKSQAPVVVVYMHAGAEGATATHVTGQEESYVGEDRGNAQAFAHAAIDDGANLVLASGPHVLRGMEWYRGNLIAYSLGDFANYNNFASVGTLSLSGILRVTLTGTGTFLHGKFISVVLSSTGTPAVDSTNQSAQLVNQLSQEDFGSAAVTINSDGSLAPPKTT